MPEKIVWAGRFSNALAAELERAAELGREEADAALKVFDMEVKPMGFTSRLERALVAACLAAGWAEWPKCTRGPVDK